MQAKSADPVLELDPVLVRRLWRPVERPGVTDPGMARAMLSRHQRMVAGLALAELVSRHTGASELAGMTVPIVYALPSQPPPTPDSRPGETRLRTPVSNPIVPARLVPTAPVSAQLAPPAPSQAAPSPPADVPAVHGVSPPRADPSPLVSVPAQPAFPASAQAAPSPPADVPAIHEVSPPLVKPSPVDLPRPDAGSSDPGFDRAPLHPGTPPVADSPVWLPALATVPANASGAAPPLLLQRKGTTPTAPGPTPPDPVPMRPRIPVGSPLVVPAVVAPAVPGAASHPEGAADSASSRVAARPPLWPGLEHPAGILAPPPGRIGRVTVVRNLPDSRPSEPLPLVDLAVMTSRTTPDRPLSVEQGQPVGSRLLVPAHGAMAGQDASAPQGVDRNVPARRQRTAPVDVERIVGVVHRRFVRQLAIEAERRAVR